MVLCIVVSVQKGETLTTAKLCGFGVFFTVEMALFSPRKPQVVASETCLRKSAMEPPQGTVYLGFNLGILALYGT
jgi:hypothetical protein